MLTRTISALAMPLLLRLPPETAHRATIAALKHAPFPPTPDSSPRLAVNAFGLAFPNPLGMAAGFDKSAEVASALLALGFGFVEVGTLTPRPQSGNPSPRLFRLAERPRGRQSHGLQQRRLWGGCGSARRATGGGNRRRQFRTEPRRRRPDRRFRRGREGFRALRQLFRDQCLLAQHAGPARSATARRFR